MSRFRHVRRLWPLALMAWERWQQLSDEEKERYRRQARQYSDKGRKAIQQRKKRR